MKRLTAMDFRVPALLVALSAVPVLGGVVRLRSLAEPVTVENARFLESPTPILLHVASVVLYCLLGALQFAPAIRQRWPRWHRIAGRVLAASGLVAGLSGLWMTVLYPIPARLQGPLLLAVRVVVAVAMVAAILVAWRAILRRDVARHEAWMIRAYALGQGAGTQALVMLPPTLMFGEITGLTRDLWMTLAWAINVGVAEWIVRRRSTAPYSRSVRLSAAASPS